MATPFTDIYDLAMIVINDYRLNRLYETDEDGFYQYMEGLLIKSIPKFASDSQTGLEYDITTSSFNNDLNLMEKDILANFVAITWFESIIQDITQVNLHLSGRDKKFFSEAQNLKEKSEYFDRLREKVRQQICDYQVAIFY